MIGTMTNFVIFQYEPLKLTTRSYKIVETKLLRQNNYIFEHLGNISHHSLSPQIMLIFVFLILHRWQHLHNIALREGHAGISGNCGQIRTK